MRSIPLAARYLALALGLAALAACDNKVPTATGRDLFPGGSAPISVDLVLPASDFVLRDTVYDFGQLHDVPYLVVAHQFDGALEAHGLASFGDFPDSVAYPAGGTSTESYTFGTGRVITQIDSATSTPNATPVSLRLWLLEQSFDSATVTWANASDQGGNPVAWKTAGGTLGRLIGETTWTPGDSVHLDTLTWTIDSAAVQALATHQASGVAVTAATAGSRLIIRTLRLIASVHPASAPDTVVPLAPSSGKQTFIVNAPPPTPPGVLRVGGITQARSVLQLDLSRPVPACAHPETTPDCPSIPLSDVTLDRALLLFTPVPVTSGYRPVSTATLSLRRLAEPELGRLAPLAGVLAQADASPALFLAGNDSSFRLDVTSAISSAVQKDSTSISTALLIPPLQPGVPQVPDVGYFWFDTTPRLRLIYTLPLRPTLP
ncbi:MAG TPA: hypothetical protein VFL93_05660 [Longimicrobiaceae bacterium]|nr:hypothetical protein [Longimicrobiaceae bacterium]